MILLTPLPYIIPVPSHNIVQRNVDHLDSPTEHYSDSLHWHHRTDWTGRVRGVCKTLVLQRVGDKYYEDSGNCRFNKVFRSLIGMWQDSPSKITNISVNLESSNRKKEVAHLVGLIGFWEQNIPPPGLLLLSIYQ